MIIYTLKKQIGKPIPRYSPFSLHILSYIYMSYFLCPWCTMLLREQLRKGNLSFTKHSYQRSIGIWTWKTVGNLL